MIRILLADDHAAFRRSLRQSLENEADIEIIAETSSGWEAVALAKKHTPDVAIIDVRMRDLSGIQAVGHILEFSPKTAILMLSLHGDKRYLLSSLQAGARGYVVKDSMDDTIVAAIRVLQRGGSYFSPEVAPLLRDLVPA